MESSEKKISITQMLLLSKVFLGTVKYSLHCELYSMRFLLLFYVRRTWFIHLIAQMAFRSICIGDLDEINNIANLI